MEQDMWQWPYTPELDRQNIGRVPIPEIARPWIRAGQHVDLNLPDGTTVKGLVKNYNRIAWIARVKVWNE